MISKVTADWNKIKIEGNKNWAWSLNTFLKFVFILDSLKILSITDFLFQRVIKIFWQWHNEDFTLQFLRLPMNNSLSLSTSIHSFTCRPGSTFQQQWFLQNRKTLYTIPWGGNAFKASQCSEINNIRLKMVLHALLIEFLYFSFNLIPTTSQISPYAQATAAFVLIHKYDINLFIMTIFLNSLCPWSQPSGGESYTASMMMPIWKMGRKRWEVLQKKKRQSLVTDSFWGAICPKQW